MWKKNIVIVNYNTQALTNAAIMSINKTTPGCSIFIFDNSDKEKFENTFENVTVIDNTHGEIIDFDEWLSSIPKEKKRTDYNYCRNYASAKHCYTIQKIIEILDEPFVLMDSDVLIKKDISGLFRDDLLYVGELCGNRLAPFICFINAKMCNELGVRYFDEKRMLGIDGRPGIMYDTGSIFYSNAKKYKHANIRVTDYIVHLGAGSYKKTNENIRKWLENNNYLWK